MFFPKNFFKPKNDFFAENVQTNFKFGKNRKYKVLECFLKKVNPVKKQLYRTWSQEDMPIVAGHFVFQPITSLLVFNEYFVRFGGEAAVYNGGR